MEDDDNVDYTSQWGEMCENYNQPDNEPEEETE